MDDADLTRRLAVLVPPDLDGARERAVLAARGRLPFPAARPTSRLRTVAALCLVVAAAGFISPPGQAVATWIAEQVGIGQPGGPPTLVQLREFWTRGTGADGVPAYVIARGAAPHEGHYEFITWRSKADGTRCFELNLVEGRSSYGGGCEPLPSKGGLLISAAGSNLDPDQELQFVAGRASEDVESVAVKFNGETVATELTPIEGALLTALGIDRPFKFYIAFLSDFRHGGNVDVTASDDAGKQVARRELEIPNFAASVASMCAEMERDWRKRGADPGGAYICP